MLNGIFTRRGRRGTVIAETALVSLVFFLLVFGIFDFGQFLFVHQALEQRARAAIRTGVVKKETTTQIRNRILYNQNTDQGGAGYFGLTTSNVSVTTVGSAGNDDYGIKATISNFPFVMLSPYLAGSKTAATYITVSIPVGMFY